MNEVIIRIIDTTNNVEGDLDLASYNDFPLAINKGIVNLDNLKERTGTYTKSFKVPNTRNNASLLSNVDNINSRKDYRKALNRKPCIILVNDSPIEKGFVQVSRVYNGLEVESFELVFYGNNIDWVKSAAELQLNQITTWEGNNQQNYTQANINALNASDSDSNDIAYPYINRGGNSEKQSTDVTDYRPVFYLKNIINKCFEKLGYKAETSFFSNNVHLKKLVCDFDLKFTEEETDTTDTFLQTYLSSEQVNTPLIDHRVPYDADFSNVGNHYSTSTFEYTVPSDGSYFIKYQISVRTIASAGGQNVDFKVVKNGQSINSIGSGVVLETLELNAPVNSAFSGGGRAGQTTKALLKDDKISIYVRGDNHQNLNFAIKGSEFTYIQITKKAEIEKNDAFLISKTIPDNIKFLDILNDFTRMFNIYYWTDVKSKKVYFDTRNEFFKSESTAIDWSDKVNVNTYEVDYVSSYKRTLNFAYNPVNKDNYLKGWQDEFKRIYASYNNVLTDRFAEGNQKIQLDSFSATYGIKDESVTESTGQAPITLRIWNDFENIPETRTTNYNFRIYFFQNKVQTVLGITNQIKAFGSNTSTIPYGIFEDYGGVISPQNLSFTGADGLFSTYYSKMLKNIEEGGRLIAFFDLTSTDIENLDFRKLIYLDNNDNIKGYYFVESVIDYKPVQGGLTKVSLFKFENIGSVDIDTTQTGNNSGIIDNSNTPPLLFPIYVEDGSQLIEVVIENPTTGLIEPVFR